jgi:dUTPase
MEFLKELMEGQVRLVNRIGVPIERLAGAERDAFSKECVLSLHAELSELLEWTNWKHWKKARVEYDEARLREIRLELVDLLHFWANLCVLWGLTPELAVEMYREKNAKNYARQDLEY